MHVVIIAVCMIMSWWKRFIFRKRRFCSVRRWYKVFNLIPNCNCNAQMNYIYTLVYIYLLVYIYNMYYIYIYYIYIYIYIYIRVHQTPLFLKKALSLYVSNMSLYFSRRTAKYF